MTNQQLTAYLVGKAKKCEMTMKRINKGNYKGAAQWMNYTTGFNLLGCNMAINDIAGSNLPVPN